MADDNVSIRLKFLVDKLGITSSQFADECKIPRPSFSQILTGRNKKISDQIIRQIHYAFPNISINWLLFNEGNPFLGQDDSQQELSSSQSDGRHPDSEGNLTDAPAITIKEDISSTEDAENAYEILNFLCKSTSKFKDGNQTAVNQEKNEGQVFDEKLVMSLLKNKDFLTEIAKLKPKTRKVVSVTIYYDDSTFETFKPA